MALPGHPAFVAFKTTNAAAVVGDEAAGISSVSYDPSTDQLDVTDFKDTTGLKQKLAGLQDGEISVEGFLLMTDAPQVVLRTAHDNKTSVWVTIHPNPSGSAGQKGFQVECKVKNWGFKLAPAEAATFSASLTWAGTAPVAV